MTFEPTNPIDEDDDQPERDDGPGVIARFRRYLAARRDAGLGHNDPDTDETKRLWP